MSAPRRDAPAALTTQAPARPHTSFASIAAAIFVVALGVRLLHVWLLSRSPFFDALLGDAHGYDEWARRIAGGEWIGTDVFYQAPLYPYFLGVIYAVAGHSLVAVRVVQAAIGAGSCALLGLAGRRFFSPRVGAIAGFGLAIYAPAIFFDALIQKSVLDLFFLTLSLWLIARIVDRPGRWPDWLALGAAMGGLSLTRENALVFVAVIVGWALLRTVRLTSDVAVEATDAGQSRDAVPAGANGRTHKTTATATSRKGRGAPRATASERTTTAPTLDTRLRAVAIFVVGLAIVLLPVAVRNYVVSGGFYLTTSQFGPNFFIGNNPQADGTYMSLRFGRGAPEYERTDATELAEHALGRTLTPGEVSTYWTDRALTFITTQPAQWLKLQARKALLLFNATEMLDTEAQESHAEWSWPLRVGGWFGHFGVLAPLALVGLVLSWNDRRRLSVLYIMLAAYAASVLMFYVFARYRLPLVPLLLLFAAAGLTEVVAWARRADMPARAWLAAAVVATAVFSNWPVLSKPLMKAITETNLAVALQTEGRTDEAAAHYRRAIELQPDYAPAYNNLGVMQRATGKVDEAIKTYERALSLKGNYPDAHYNLANALLEKNRPQEAAEHFSIALRSIPDSAGAANNLGIALSAQNRPQDAVAAFRAAVAAEPNSPVAHRNLADALASAGQVSEAVAEFRKAIALAPKESAAHYNLGVVLLESGQMQEAIRELRTAVELAPTSVDAHNNLGIALGSTGDLDAAIAEFRRALAIDPTSSQARQNLQMAEQARTQPASGRK
jgi:tetratricopeptide (TPR) repeat protein